MRKTRQIIQLKIVGKKRNLAAEKNTDKNQTSALWLVGRHP